MKQELLAAIDKAVEAGTFNLDSVRRVQELREAYNSVVEQLASSKRSVGELSVSKAQLEADLAKAQKLIELAGKTFEREQAVKVKEAVLVAHEQHHKDYLSLVQRVFRSPVFREEVSRSGSGQIPQTGQYSSGNESITRTIEEDAS